MNRKAGFMGLTGARAPVLRAGDPPAVSPPVDEKVRSPLAKGRCSFLEPALRA